jgi:hypothetical protein
MQQQPSQSWVATSLASATVTALRAQQQKFYHHPQRQLLQRRTSATTQLYAAAEPSSYPQDSSLPRISLVSNNANVLAGASTMTVSACTSALAAISSGNQQQLHSIIDSLSAAAPVLQR